MTVKKRKETAFNSPLKKVPIGFGPMNNGFADRPLRPLGYSTNAICSINITKIRVRGKHIFDTIFQVE